MFTREILLSQEWRYEYYRGAWLHRLVRRAHAELVKGHATSIQSVR